MKGKIKYFAITSLFVITIIVFAITNNHVNANTFDNKLIAENKGSYTSQRSIHDIKSDGWVYVFEIDYPDNKKDKNMYIFDGYNLKYKELDGFYVPYINSKTGEEIDRIIPNYITLSISETYKKDIRKIGDFFNKQQFNDKITIDNLKDLEIKNFSKEYLVDMFNKALASELKTTPGEYYDSSFIDKTSVTSTDENMIGEWQISYLLDFGYISDVNIEFIDSEGNYLSDVAQNKNASATGKTMFSNIQEMENNIVKTQKIESSLENLAKEKIAINSDLDKLLNKFSKKLKPTE